MTKVPRRSLKKAEHQSAVKARAMLDADVAYIMEIEERAYPFPWTAGIFRDCIRAGYCCHVLEDGGRLIAYAVMTVGGGEAHILNICVSPNEQCQGHGRMLMNKLIAQARRLGADTMFLEVRPSNAPALHLYHRLGFNEIGVRNNYYPADQGREDALIFALHL